MPIPFKEEFLIFSGKHWNIILHKDQSFLGRCVVYLKTQETDDLMKLTKEEKNELWDEVMPKLSYALKKAFGADRINYAHLANLKKHVHWHVAPRYEKTPKKEFAGEIFVDERLGKNFFNVPPKILPTNTTQRIADEIKKYL